MLVLAGVSEAGVSRLVTVARVLTWKYSVTRLPEKRGVQLSSSLTCYSSLDFWRRGVPSLLFDLDILKSPGGQSLDISYFIQFHVLKNYTNCEICIFTQDIGPKSSFM